MNLRKQSILGVSVTTSPKEKILASIEHFLSTKRPGILTIVTPNPEQIMLAQKNNEFRRILNDADIALPDGTGLVWAVKKIANFQRIPGREFMVDLCRMAANIKANVLFIGGLGVAQTALSNLQRTIPKLHGVALDGPMISDTPTVPTEIIDQIIRTIRGNNIRMVFLGFGAPKQEYIMARVKSQDARVKGCLPFVVMAVGGSFDVLSGKIPFAPVWMEHMGLEWLWRLLQEPRRWKRQLVLLQFIWNILISHQ